MYTLLLVWLELLRVGGLLPPHFLLSVPRHHDLHNLGPKKEALWSKTTHVAFPSHPSPDRGFVSFARARWVFLSEVWSKKQGCFRKVHQTRGLSAPMNGKCSGQQSSWLKWRRHSRAGQRNVFATRMFCGRGQGARPRFRCLTLQLHFLRACCTVPVL